MQVREHIAARLEQINALGVLVKDLDTGLIDFPTLRDGHEVYLCWKLGEGERIQWWHEIEDGFAGRQPLDPESEAALQRHATIPCWHREPHKPAIGESRADDGDGEVHHQREEEDHLARAQSRQASQPCA